MTFKHLDRKRAVFQGFQSLEKSVMNFKYFQALQGRIRTLYCFTTLSNSYIFIVKFQRIPLK